MTDCSDSPASIWLPRFLADRPVLAPNGAPVVLWYGGMDTTIAPGYAQCELDKLTRSLPQLSSTLPPASEATIWQCGKARHIRYMLRPGSGPCGPSGQNTCSVRGG